MTTKPKARKFRIKRPDSPQGAAPQQDAKPQQPRPSAPPPQAATPASSGDAASTNSDMNKAAPRRAAAQPPAGAAPSASARPASGSAPSSASGSANAPAPSPGPARSGEVSSAAQVSGEIDMDAIRREGLTGRQLRMARRVAQKHGLAPTSDFDAVRLLRTKGIDPFQRSNMLELVVPQAGTEQRDGAPPEAFGTLPAQAGGAGSERVQLPQTVPAGGGRAVGTPQQMSPAERRTREISEIQRDISRRRRKKMGLLMVRLAFFVMLPTIFAGYYFYKIATPMYATESQFLILTSEGGGSTGGLGGLLPSQFATSADSIAVQSYLQSKDAMLRLDGDVGFRDHFTDESIDPIQRLTPDPTNEEAYKMFKKNIKIGYDPTEGVMRMEIVAADPEVATVFSDHLIRYAEERVNNLSQQKREDQMSDANLAYEQAQIKRREVQERLIQLQVTSGVDPAEQIAAIRGQISSYQTLLYEKELELAALLDNARPNRAKVEGAQGDVRRLKALLGQLEGQMNEATEGANSLAQKAVEMQLAQADLAAADANLQLALTAMDAARTEANRQVRYLTVAVEPVASQEASYPRSFENTILTFLIFSGIYLMISLTSSILREQVTS
ncbi:MAG: capsule biosynthesis protein [Sulfitobacter sp.]